LNCLVTPVSEMALVILSVSYQLPATGFPPMLEEFEEIIR